jgi:hypothetical protein
MGSISIGIKFSVFKKAELFEFSHTNMMFGLMIGANDLGLISADGVDCPRESLCMRFSANAMVA